MTRKGSIADVAQLKPQVRLPHMRIYNLPHMRIYNLHFTVDGVRVVQHLLFPSTICKGKEQHDTEFTPDIITAQHYAFYT